MAEAIKYSVCSIALAIGVVGFVYASSLGTNQADIQKARYEAIAACFAAGGTDCEAIK